MGRCCRKALENEEKGKKSRSEIKKKGGGDIGKKSLWKKNNLSLLTTGKKRS